MSETKIKTATILKRVLVDVRLEATPPNHTIAYWMTPQQKANALREWVRDFEDFIRDHRSQSQGAVILDVVEEHKDLCSACKHEWDPDSYEDGTIHCGWCGAALVPEATPEPAP